MDITALVVIIGALFLMVILVIIFLVLIFQIRKLQGSKTELSPILQNMAQAMQEERTQMAVLNEKLTHLEPVTQTVSDLQADVRGLGERIITVESNQSKVYQGVGYLANNALSSFSELKALTNGLTEATAAMRSELSGAKTDLTDLHTHARNEQETERQIADSIRRLEMVIAGTQTKGAAGENLLEVVFAKLPAEWQMRDFKLGGKSVEFGLKLPNNLILPIDSKWTATNLVELFTATEDVQEKQKIKRSIEEAVLQKAKEVRKYLDPNLTVNFGVAVIPDAVYDLCGVVQIDAFQMNVVLVSYSMFVPYLLLVFQTVLKTCQSIDLQKLDAYLQTAQANIGAMQEEIDGRFSRAITMLGNSRDDMRAHLGKIGGSLSGLQIGAGAYLDSEANLEPSVLAKVGQ